MRASLAGLRQLRKTRHPTNCIRDRSTYLK